MTTRGQMPDVIVPPRPPVPVPPVLPPNPPERDDPAEPEPDEPEDEPPALNHATGLGAAEAPVPDWLTRIYFGYVGNTDPGLPYDDGDPDDELLPVTPIDVVMMLGFDPLELSEEGAATDAPVQNAQIA